MYRHFDKSLAMQAKFHALIPGGSHTYAKGDDQFPQFMPPYIVKGEGCKVWDADGNEFMEYGIGLRAVSLGHGFKSVADAAAKQMYMGNNYTRPATIELEAAEVFLDTVPFADMVKFCKNGSDATTAAVKLARAYTGKKKIALCRDHPFFSQDDWFMGSTPIDTGIPQVIKELTVTFPFDCIDSARQMFADNPGQIACVIMEAEKYTPATPGYLNELKALCHEHGALFILDEMITGYRWDIGGAQTFYDFEPDLSTFGKAMGNGFAISALAGKREYMELGGIFHDKERVFLLSATHGAENHALAAFMEVVNVYKTQHVVPSMNKYGAMLKEGLTEVIASHGLEKYMQILGRPVCMVFTTKDQEGNPSQPFRTLFMQECIKRGLLAPNLVISFSHQEEEVKRTIEIFDGALEVYKKGLEEGVDKYLVGRSVQPVYTKKNKSTHIVKSW